MLPTLTHDNFNLVRTGRKTAFLIKGTPLTCSLAQANIHGDQHGQDFLVTIQRIEIKRASDLHPQDAKDIGYATFARLQAVLDDCVIEPEDTVTVIHFVRE